VDGGRVPALRGQPLDWLDYSAELKFVVANTFIVRDIKRIDRFLSVRAWAAVTASIGLYAARLHRSHPEPFGILLHALDG
jgi:hypothetical protein